MNDRLTVNKKRASVSIPVALIRDHNLSNLSVRILLFASTCNFSTYKMNRRGLCKVMDCSISSIDRALNELKEEGYLKTTKRRTVNGNFENVYFFNLTPGEYDDTDPDEDNSKKKKPSAKKESHKNTKTTTTVYTDTASKMITEPETDNAEPETERSCTGDTKETLPAPAEQTVRPSAPTLEEVEEFALSINAKCNVKRYYLIRSSHEWQTLSGKTVTNWRLDFQLWELRERPSTDTPCAAAPSQSTPGKVYSKAQRRSYYAGFQERTTPINIDDITIDLDSICL